MSFHRYLFVICFGALLSLATWGLVLWRIDPFETGWLGILLFYITFFTALFGVILVFLTIYRVFIRRREFIFRETVISCRHAFFLSLYATALLILVSQNRLEWWLFILISCLLLVCESFALLMDGSRVRT